MLRLASFVTVFLLGAGTAFAGCEPGVVGNDYLNTFRIKRITGYIPKMGGINGSAHQSASGADPSRYSFENFEKGKNEIVMIAIPQMPHHPHGRSRYFKSIARVPAIEKAIGKCVMFYAGDHYGRSSNWAGEFGKIDIVHEPPYRNATKFNWKDKEVYIMSGPQTVKNKRVIYRLPDAVSPLPPTTA
jgi:hypothetical protein